MVLTILQKLGIDTESLAKKVNEKISITRKILQKDSSYLKNFVEIVNKDFETNVTEKDFKDAELDYPPKLSEEMFNYKKDK